MDNLYFVDRIDCERASWNLGENIDDIEKIAERYAPPTLLISCGEKEKAEMFEKYLNIFELLSQEAKCPLGLHIHLADSIWKEYRWMYSDPGYVKKVMAMAKKRFEDYLGYAPNIFGMGHLACSVDSVADLLAEMGFTIDLGDLIHNKYGIWNGEILSDYRTWEIENPIIRKDVVWLPTGTDGIASGQAPGFLGINFGQTKEIIDNILNRYRLLAERGSERVYVVGSIIHPFELDTKRRLLWHYIHERAMELGYGFVTSLKAADIVRFKTSSIKED